jgi:hypothetical protein
MQCYIYSLIFLITSASPLISRSNLTENNPFIPPHFQAPPPPVEQENPSPPVTPIKPPYIFKGFFIVNDTPYFSLHNTLTSQSRWLHIDQVWDDVIVQSFNFTSLTIQLQYNSNLFSLPLEKPSIINTTTSSSSSSVADSPSSIPVPPRRTWREQNPLNSDEIEQQRVNRILRQVYSSFTTDEEREVFIQQLRAIRHQD